MNKTSHPQKAKKNLIIKKFKTSTSINKLIENIDEYILEPCKSYFENNIKINSYGTIQKHYKKCTMLRGPN